MPIDDPIAIRQAINTIIVWNLEVRQICNKAALIHPVSECIYHIALRFSNNYVGYYKPRYVLTKYNILHSLHAETGCGNSA
jgi:hypothetical protein